MGCFKAIDRSQLVVLAKTKKTNEIKSGNGYHYRLLFYEVIMIQRSTLLLSILFIASFGVCSAQIQAIELEHDKGTLVIKKTPSRIVVLAFSFADALAIADVSPVGIADDGDINKLIPSVRSRIGTWQSVGSRYQPSLEAISSLKPDLIIADSVRHQSIYNDLMVIAPTLMFKSQGVTYRENLQITQKIAKAVNKVDLVNSRLEEHFQLMGRLKKKFKTNDTFQFAVISDKGMWAHSPHSYAGSVIAELGLNSPIDSKNKNAYISTGFEQFIKLNPDWLFVGKYTNRTVLDKWKESPLWKLLKINKSKQLISVPINEWSLASGVLSAEKIALEIESQIQP